MKKSSKPLRNATKLILCCNGSPTHYAVNKYWNVNCLGSGSSHSQTDLEDDTEGDMGRDKKCLRNNNKIKSDKSTDKGGAGGGEAVCLLRESPFRILRVAESGNGKEFERLITADPSKLNVRDGRGRAAVHQATIRNHVSILRVLVTFHGNLNLVDSHGNTPLHLAVDLESLDALDFLLSNWADSRILNHRMQSPLHLACENNKISALRVLTKYREMLDVNQGGEHGRTALHLAATNDHEECMRILLYEIGACPRRPCKYGFFPIHEAAKHASSRSMERLLTWGEHNGCAREEMISFFDAEGNVPLHSAVHGGDIKAVELCIKSGARISIQQHDLSTPVHLACSQGSMDIVKLMFTLQPQEKETCLKSCDLQRMTPLHCAAMFDHCELVEYLALQGASVNVLDKERRSPLHLSAFRNGWRTMRALLKLGASISVKDNDSRNVLHILVIHGGDLDKIFDDELTIDLLSIIEERDKNGYTALHYAAKLGHIKTAQRLLKLGANVIAKNNVGENVFHIACRYGRVNIINHILKMELNNTVINEGDGKGLTPLHIASMEGHVRVAQALLKKGAILHRDHDGRTPLHLASKNGHKDTMRLILNVHSHLLDQTDKNGNTSLHVAAVENQPDAVHFLLTMNCTLTYNRDGFSAIDFALQNKFSIVAMVMVTHSVRGDEVLAMSGGKHPSIMLGLVTVMPHVVSTVLDRCIIKSDVKSDSENYNIKYDFKWLVLPDDTDEERKPEERQLAEFSEFSEIDRLHLPILNGMVCYGRVELLSHELSSKYLQMKWNAYGKYIHLSQLILHVIYLALLTSFATNIVDLYNSDSNSDWIRMVEKVRPDLIHKLCAFFILCVAIFNLLRECSNIYRQKVKYALDTMNWVFWAMNVSCVLMVFNYFFDQNQGSGNTNTSAAIAVFLGWFYLLLFLQRFDVVGIYVVMFLEILHTLIRVLMIFSILIVAFGLAFYILLSSGKHVAFSGILQSLMRTFFMMLGDLDYINSFVNPYHADNATESTPSPPKCGVDYRTIPHPFASFLMLGVFVVFMPILLMNLLIGLAVGDIESVRRNAQLKRLAMQVQLHTALEKTLPRFMLLRVDKKMVIEYPNARKVRLSLIDYLFKYFQPKCRQNDSDTVEEDTDGVKLMVQESNAALLSLSNHLENIETLMRLLCHKMELNTDADYMDEGTTVDSGNLMSDIRSKFRRGATVRLTKKPPPPKRSDSSAI